MTKKKEWTLLALILLAGFGARLFLLGRFPDGINQDEAYAGYQAYSLLHYGIDAEGYHNPVYFKAWGDGMNALYSYLTIPVLLLGGGRLTLFAIRLPQAVFACLTLAVFYLLLRRLFDDIGTCLLGLLILAVSPWHIILSRWGLEANLAPAFLVFGLYFWIRAMENPRFFPGAAVCYGLSLYCYAPLWAVVPLILLLQFAFAVFTGKWRPEKFFFLSVGVLGLTALPLLLFVLVNRGILPEIRTGVFSIPRMLVFRGGELSPANLKVSVLNLYRLLAGQGDGTVHNTAGEFGLFYPFSTVFILIGAYGFAKDTWACLRERKYRPRALVIMQIIPVVLFGLAIADANVNKLNAMMIPLILCCVRGFALLGELLRKSVLGYAAFAYALCFAGFYPYLLTEFNDRWCMLYWTGGGEAIEAALEKTEGTVYAGAALDYPVILFYTQTPAPEYLEQVRYQEGTTKAAGFGRFVCGVDSGAIDENGAYIVGVFEKAGFEEIGFTTETYGSYVVAWKETGP